MEEEDTNFRFSSPVLLGLIGLSTMGYLSNGKAMVHIIKTFTMSKSVYIVTLIDSMLSMIGFMVCQGTILSMFLVPDVAYDEVGCSILALALIVPMQIGPFFLTVLSGLRWSIVRDRSHTSQKEKMYRGIVLGLTVLAFVFLALVHGWAMYNGGAVAPIHEVCLDDKSVKFKRSKFITIPNVITSLLPIIFDCLTVCNVRNTVNDSMANKAIPSLHQQAAEALNDDPEAPKASKKDPLEIPVRATVLSSISGVIHLFILGILGALNIPSGVKVMFMPFLCMTVNIIRCPLIVVVTMKKNEMNAVISKREERQKRQALEVKFALEARAKRLSNEPRDPFA